MQRFDGFWSGPDFRTGRPRTSTSDFLISDFYSESGNPEAGDALEVLDIDRGYVEAKMQGRGSDHEVLEIDGDAHGGLFALDASGKLGDLQRHRMHDQAVEDALGEDAPPCAVGVGPGPEDAMRQFNYADSRERVSISPCVACIRRRMSSMPSPRRSLSMISGR